MRERPILHGYWRSSAAYRVRIALNLKGIEVRHAPVHLRRGEQRADAFRGLNPAGLVPVFEEADGVRLTQSLAILEYLEEIHPEPPLLPGSPRARAMIREIALDVVADIHPIGNLRIMDKLSADFGADGDARAAWIRHWIAVGFDAVERRIATTAGRFAVGGAPTLADVCLVPQVYNARRFGLDLAPWPILGAVDEACRALPAFAAAAPDLQPDAE